MTFETDATDYDFDDVTFTSLEMTRFHSDFPGGEGMEITITLDDSDANLELYEFLVELAENSGCEQPRGV